MKSLINRDEIRRLEKAARDKDKTKLRDWAMQYEMTISAFIQDGYENMYRRELANGFDTLVLAMMYTLATDKNVTIDKENAEIFLDNFYKTIDGFRVGSYKPDDYLSKLEELDIKLTDYNYTQRLTDIVAFVLSDEYIDKRDKLIELFNKQGVIILELDNIKGDEAQIRKNIDKINMCTRMYYLGNSDLIEAYKVYALQIKKPVIEALFTLHEEFEKELEEDYKNGEI